MNESKNKKIILITGASKGLGKSLAEKLSESDSILILCSKNLKELNEVCFELNNIATECYAYEVDVSEEASIVKFLRMVLDKFSKIDILINNAGAIHLGKPVEKITDEEFKLCMETNLNSVFYALREVIPAMKKRGTGTIITISSTAGKRGNPDFAAYSASKFAVAGLIQSTARSLEGSGIRCLNFFPSGMNTDMRKYILGEEDAKKQQTSESVAEIIKKTIENPVEFPNGSEIEIRNGKVTSTSVI